jgi:hypothetical protein
LNEPYPFASQVRFSTVRWPCSTMSRLALFERDRAADYGFFSFPTTATLSIKRLAFSVAPSHTCVCMPVALYLRVSTEEQGIDSATL